MEGTPWDGHTLYDLYSEAYTPWEWQPKLKEIANDLGLDLFSSPFDPTAVDFLEKMDVPAYKIASFEIVDILLIEKMARTSKPLFISTGMATLSEIREAVNTASNAGATQIALLKCTSAYPALPEEMNLRSIPHLADAFHVPAGLSDHTLGIAVPVAGRYDGSVHCREAFHPLTRYPWTRQRLLIGTARVQEDGRSNSDYSESPGAGSLWSG